MSELFHNEYLPRLRLSLPLIFNHSQPDVVHSGSAVYSVNGVSRNWFGHPGKSCIEKPLRLLEGEAISYFLKLSHIMP
jgi:hypothetical protein